MGRHGPREGALAKITPEAGVEIYVHIAIAHIYRLMTMPIAIGS